MGLISHIVDVQGYVLGEGALDTKVPEGVHRGAPPACEIHPTASTTPTARRLRRGQVALGCGRSHRTSLSSDGCGRRLRSAPPTEIVADLLPQFGDIRGEFRWRAAAQSPDPEGAVKHGQCSSRSTWRPIAKRVAWFRTARRPTARRGLGGWRRKSRRAPLRTTLLGFTTGNSARNESSISKKRSTLPYNQRCRP